MKIDVYSTVNCRFCSCKWKLPLESRKAVDDILGCSKKKCPFQKSKTWEWYYDLMAILGPDKPEYPDDPHEDLPQPIQGYVYAAKFKGSS